MKRLSVALSLCLAACSPGADDAPAVKGMRSAAAEWALVNREGAAGRLTHSYIIGMRQAARDEIDNEARALRDKQSPAAVHANALHAMPDDAPARAIKDRADALDEFEKTLEPA